MYAKYFVLEFIRAAMLCLIVTGFVAVFSYAVHGHSDAFFGGYFADYGGFSHRREPVHIISYPYYQHTVGFDISLHSGLASNQLFPSDPYVTTEYVWSRSGKVYPLRSIGYHR